ncbi:MAG TPA: ABC transporter ATP-binding protein [Bacteroidetes bacterium]|nr:ABC transporter ATP-binding protein [Bacteroidota bacterium]
MIKITNLHKSFGKNKVLKGVDLLFDKPGITAVLGPNGSGKTTLIKCLLGMVIPNDGEIYVDGKNVARQWAYRDQIDYLPQIARFPENLTVKELLKMIKDLRPRKADDQRLIQLFELEPFLDKKLGNLSGGTRQKVNIVAAFMYDSPILVLDEPTVGLDPVAMIQLKELIWEEKAKGKTILLTTHIMGFVEEMADDIVFLLEGKIHFNGSLKGLKKQYGQPTLERTIAEILKQSKVVISEAVISEAVNSKVVISEAVISKAVNSEAVINEAVNSNQEKALITNNCSTNH